MIILFDYRLWSSATSSNRLMVFTVDCISSFCASSIETTVGATRFYD
ncbi:hypothetical protein JCM19297_626 [Nonlabens ulvanivorans]|nr:hypothetical protein JCM19297_626 [Nonlabens ulvanivorans]